MSVATIATAALVGRLEARDGVPGSLANLASASNLSPTALPQPLIHAGHYSIDHNDRTQGLRYPQLTVYCERIENTLKQKFQRFSGQVNMVIEVRNSEDHLRELERLTQVYVSAVTAVLETSRGEWPGGICYTGRYEVSFEAVRQGGRNFTQTARIRVPLDVNIA